MYKYFGAHGHIDLHLPGLIVVRANDLINAQYKLRRQFGWCGYSLSDVDEELQAIEGEWAKTLRPSIEQIENNEKDYYTYLGDGVYYFEI